MATTNTSSKKAAPSKSAVAKKVTTPKKSALATPKPQKRSKLLMTMLLLLVLIGIGLVMSRNLLLPLLTSPAPAVPKKIDITAVNFTAHDAFTFQERQWQIISIDPNYSVAEAIAVAQKAHNHYPDTRIFIFNDTAGISEFATGFVAAGGSQITNLEWANAHTVGEVLPAQNAEGTPGWYFKNARGITAELN